MRVLGPLELTDMDGGLVPVIGKQARALLALLATAAPLALSYEELHQELWPDGPPRSAVHALQVYVSRLRTALERAGLRSSALARSGEGYRLDLPADRIDARDFEDALLAAERTSADPLKRRCLLEGALRLWREEPLSEFREIPRLRAAASRLGELRIDAVQRLAEALILTGHHEEAVAQLGELVGRAPLRERPRTLMMVALYRLGRVEEALEHYTSAFLAATELGLQPGPRLMALAEAIRRADDALIAPDPVPGATTGPSAAEAPGPGAVRPPPVSLAVPPTPPYGFVGRRRELERASDLLADPDVRLLTLNGPGGVGKTCLALAAAQEVADRFPDGVCFVSLGALSNPSEVLVALAAVLGIAEDHRLSVLQRLEARLGARRVLFVFDNFEHVLAAREDLARLLARAPGVKAIATTRVALGVEGEAALAVEPLEPAEAAELFLQRAEEVRPGIGRSAAEREAVNQICARCDGLPLALEIVAPRVEVFSLEALASRLQDRLDVTAPGDVPDRHRTLRVTIGWSYFGLPAPEQRALRLLSAFADSARFSALRAVADPEERDGLRGHLDALIAQSLVREQPGSDGDLRYSMLTTVREFAHQQLIEGSETEAAADRHAGHFVAFAEAAAEGLVGAEQLRWLRSLDDERANLRLAIARLGEADPPRCAHLRAVLGHYWDLRGQWMEAHDQMRLALETDCASADRCRILFWLGRQAWRRRRLEEAQSLLQQARQLAEQEEDLRIQAHVTGYLWMLGEDAPALHLEDQKRIISRARRGGDMWVLAVALWEHGDALQLTGNWAETQAVLQEAVRVAREIGNPQAVGVATGILGESALRQGELELAKSLLSESLEQARLIGHRWVVFSNLGDLAVLALHRNDLQEAARHLRQAAAEFELGVANEARSTLAAGAALAGETGQPLTAARLWSAYDRTRKAHALGHSGGAGRLWELSLPRAQATCTPEVWETAWRHGQRLNDVMAVRLAGLAAERCLAGAGA